MGASARARAGHSARPQARRHAFRHPGRAVRRLGWPRGHTVSGAPGRGRASSPAGEARITSGRHRGRASFDPGVGSTGVRPPEPESCSVGSHPPGARRRRRTIKSASSRRMAPMPARTAIVHTAGSGGDEGSRCATSTPAAGTTFPRRAGPPQAERSRGAAARHRDGTGTQQDPRVLTTPTRRLRVRRVAPRTDAEPPALVVQVRDDPLRYRPARRIDALPGDARGRGRTGPAARQRRRERASVQYGTVAAWARSDGRPRRRVGTG